MHAHFDCFAGISGDMTLGAFIDLGVPTKWLTKQLGRIPLSGFQINADRVVRHGISATSITVGIASDKSSRTWVDIRSMIDASPLEDLVKQLSLSIFERLAVAEAGIHHTPPDNVHFHEVGGLDAMVDIIGTALCIRYLEIESVSASRIALGSGLVKCQHGTLPVPSPATLSILKGIPVGGTNIGHELTTPTGAAIVAVLADHFGVMPEMTIKQVGYGAGSRDHREIPNLLRITVGYADTGPHDDESSGVRTEPVVVVETAIDDMNPEFFGYIMERLYRDGALDVCWIPAYMKKNRPGNLIQVLCKPDKKEALVKRLLSETTSLGVRYYSARRDILYREIVRVDSSFGPVKAKRVKGIEGNIRLVPEYETCRKIAMEQNRSIRKVYDVLLREFQTD